MEIMRKKTWSEANQKKGKTGPKPFMFLGPKWDATWQLRWLLFLLHLSLPAIGQNCVAW